MKVYVKFGDQFEFKIKRTACIGNLRKTFCQKQNIRISTVRLLIDGQRINDKESAHSLNLKEGTIIEAFKEINGGGLPDNKKKCISIDEISAMLDEQTENEETFDSDSSTDDIDDSKQEIPKPDAHSKEYDQIKIQTGQKQILEDDKQTGDRLVDVEVSAKNQNQEEQTRFIQKSVEQKEEEIVVDLRILDDNDEYAKEIQEPEAISKETENIKGQTDRKKTIENDKQTGEGRMDKEVDDSEQEFQESYSKEIGDGRVDDEDMLHDTDINIENDSLEWLSILRNQFNDGKFTEKRPLHKKIIYYLQLPKLEPVELKILKSIVDMKTKLDEWAVERGEPVPKEIRKRKRGNFTAEKRERCLRSKLCSTSTLQKQEENDKETNGADRRSLQVGGNISGGAEIEENRGTEETNTKDNQRNTIEPDACSETPNHRKILFRKFGMCSPSPLIKKKKPTEEELRRLSVAVHLWAEKSCGGIKILQEVRLTDRHMKEIFNFAGPYSKWKLLKERSILQYKNMWRNTIKGQHHYHGHPETGFENKMKVHDPSDEFCPFGHCRSGIMIDMDLIMLTPKRIPSSTNITNLTVSANRKLFSPIKSHEKIQIDQDDVTFDDWSSEDNHQFVVKPSPTKQELKQQNRYLLKQVKLLKKKGIQDNIKKQESKKEIPKMKIQNIMKCEIENCGKEFTTVIGLSKHQKKIHEQNIEEKTVQICALCGKSVIYIDQHINAIHKEEIGDEICEVCQVKVQGDMKKHRGKCIFCPFCGYENKKKTRLLNHIVQCQKKKELISIQTEPLDLTPKKPLEVSNNQTEPLDLTPSTNKDFKETNTKRDTQDLTSIRKDIVNEVSSIQTSQIENFMEVNEVIVEKCSNSENIEAFKFKKRLRFPFDVLDDDEFYLSEFEDGDQEEFTIRRRNIKDKIELELREIDDLENTEQEGDEEILKQFRMFMKIKSSRPNKEGGYSQVKKVSTVKMYTGAVGNDLLPAFHRLLDPFDSRWILDCTTPKDCTFDGEKRCFVNQEEPIYFTSRILSEALEKYKSNVEKGGQRATVLAAAIHFMDFIELNFNNKLNLYGREPLEKVITYHNGVRSFIKGTNVWKTCNQDKERAQQNNKIRQEYEHPNKEAEILENYQKYIKSQERMSYINKILKFSRETAPKPSDGEITELAKIVMGEIVASTGCRPVVVRHLTVGAYVDKKPGFNPYKVTKDDCVVDEEHDNIKIYRRVNPNLPPKDKACQHQLDLRLAECPQLCEDRCDPEGYNLYVTWDKTFGTKGPSYLHLIKPVKDVIDLYDIARSKYFEGRKSPWNSNEDWLNDQDTPFFLNSACSPFQSVDLKHITKAMGVDVTAYSFRKIVSTWALSHDSEEIRNAEEEALQHGLKVAKDKYLQNKQIKPQTLTQKYAEEEMLFPKSVRETIENKEVHAKSIIKKTEEQRAKKRIEVLLDEKATSKKSQLANKPLGPRHRILGTHRNKFIDLIQGITGEETENLLLKMTPLVWRNYIVRILCTTEDLTGELLRKLWIKIYKGDLRWGIRDARLRAKENNWPRKDRNDKNKDRNSWIASSIRQSCLTNMKVRGEKKT